jgi:L-alanine-DL-glutamate epimerase-like enolase superfamily enzyme
MTAPHGIGDRLYVKDKFRVGKDGYVNSPTKPGLGIGLDRSALDKLTVKTDR